MDVRVDPHTDHTLWY